MSPDHRPASWFRRALWLCLESAALVCVAAVLGLAANALSPVGLDLFGTPPWVYTEGAMLSLEEAEEAYYSGAIFVDARTEEDYSSGHVAGALHVDAYTQDAELVIFERLGHLPMDVPIVTYCDDLACGSSVHLAKELVAFGFADVAVLEPGWSAWVEAALPMSEGAPDPGSLDPEAF